MLSFSDFGAKLSEKVITQKVVPWKNKFFNQCFYWLGMTEKWYTYSFYTILKYFWYLKNQSRSVYGLILGFFGAKIGEKSNTQKVLPRKNKFFKLSSYSS